MTWLSRSDWNGTLPTETVRLTLTELLKKDLKDIRYDPADYERRDAHPGCQRTASSFGRDTIGLDYNDPKVGRAAGSDDLRRDELPDRRCFPLDHACQERWKPPAPVTRTAPRV